jgi:hypothetical protein
MTFPGCGLENVLLNIPGFGIPLGSWMTNVSKNVVVVLICLPPGKSVAFDISEVNRW